MRAALVLAAGASRRFGTRDKRRERLLGRRLIDHALDRAAEAGAARIVLVTDRHIDGVPRAVRQIRARKARAGIGASLVAGLRALRPIEREVLIFLADTPFARAPRALRLGPGDEAARPVWRGQPGHPLLVRTRIARALATPADRGIAGALRRLRAVPGDAASILDIDTPARLARLRRRIAAPGAAFRLHTIRN